MTLSNVTTDPFGDVDGGKAPQAQEEILLRRVDGDYFSKVIQWFFERVFENCKPASILEIGCGTGHILDYACRQSGAVGTGVDRSEFLAKQAAARFPSYAISQADGRELPFENGSFDLAFISTVLVHAAEPERIVREMARVVRPGGVVALLDQDFETAVLYPGDRTLTRRMLNAAADYWEDGWIGRRLPSLLGYAGLEIRDFDATVRIDRRFDEGFFHRIRDWVVEKGFPAADADAWLEALRVGGTKPDYIFSRNFYCAIGLK